MQVLGSMFFQSCLVGHALSGRDWRITAKRQERLTCIAQSKLSRPAFVHVCRVCNRKKKNAARNFSLTALTLAVCAYPVPPLAPTLGGRRSARIYSRFIIAINFTEIFFGHTASHS